MSALTTEVTLKQDKVFFAYRMSFIFAVLLLRYNFKSLFKRFWRRSRGHCRDIVIYGFENNSCRKWCSRGATRRYGRFRFFKMAAVRLLDFQKLEILTAHTLRRAKVRRRHHAKFCANRSRRCGDMAVFQDGGRPPSWICYTPIWTTHEVYFGGLCHCAKFFLNQFSGFDNMQVLIFWALSLTSSSAVTDKPVHQSVALHHD